MTKQEADFIGSMNMCDEISNEAYKKIMCNCEVEESQPCEDKQDCEHCIHRYGTLGCCDMVNNKWIYDCDFGREQYKKEHGKPCEDCISRAEVLKLIDYINFRNFSSYENLIAKINDLPSITPKRKKGMWIDIGYSLSKCNCCKLETKSPRYYCPNCGAENGFKVKRSVNLHEDNT